MCVSGGKNCGEGVSQFVHVNALETNELSNQCHDIFVKRAFSQPFKSFPVFTRLSVTQSQKAYNKKKTLANMLESWIKRQNVLPRLSHLTTFKQRILLTPRIFGVLVRCCRFVCRRRSVSVKFILCRDPTDMQPHWLYREARLTALL